MATTPELVTRCETRFGDPNHAIYTAANWLSYLNEAYEWVQASHPYWPWKEKQSTSVTITGGTPTVTLPTDAWRVSLVFDTTHNIKLEDVANRVQHRDLTLPAEAGDPLWYRLRANTLEVFPCPVANTTLTVEYFGPEAALATSGPVNPVFPVMHHQILTEYALYLAYMDDDDVQTAQLHEAKASERLQAMVDDLLSPRTEHNPVIVDDWYGE